MGTQPVTVDTVGVAVRGQLVGAAGMRRILVGALRVCFLASCESLISGCDGSLSVDGSVPEAGCNLELWRNTGPIWGKQDPAPRRKAEVGGEFDVHWTVSGPSKLHWLEITCPSGGRFKSHEFEAGHAGVKVSLGKVTLSPPVPTSPPAKASR